MTNLMSDYLFDYLFVYFFVNFLFIHFFSKQSLDYLIRYFNIFDFIPLVVILLPMFFNFSFSLFSAFRWRSHGRCDITLIASCKYCRERTSSFWFFFQMREIIMTMMIIIMMRMIMKMIVIVQIMSLHTACLQFQIKIDKNEKFPSFSLISIY